MDSAQNLNHAMGIKVSFNVDAKVPANFLLRPTV